MNTITENSTQVDDECLTVNQTKEEVINTYLYKSISCYKIRKYKSKITFYFINRNNILSNPYIKKIYNKKMVIDVIRNLTGTYTISHRPVFNNGNCMGLELKSITILTNKDSVVPYARDFPYIPIHLYKAFYALED